MPGAVTRPILIGMAAITELDFAIRHLGNRHREKVIGGRRQVKNVRLEDVN
jgi:hypothetical protein